MKESAEARVNGGGGLIRQIRAIRMICFNQRVVHLVDNLLSRPRGTNATPSKDAREKGQAEGLRTREELGSYGVF